MCDQRKGEGKTWRDVYEKTRWVQEEGLALDRMLGHSAV